MKRQLQIKNGLAQGEWEGNGILPVPPDGSWTFLDVTDRPDAQVGFAYDAATDTFSPPPAPPDYGPTLNVREFMDLFTVTEFKAIRQAAKTDPDVDYFFVKAQLPVPVRLRHPSTLAGLDLLVAKGLLTPARKLQIAGL